LNDEHLMAQPPKSRVPAILTYVAVGAVMFGAGMLLESYLVGRTPAAAKTAQEPELKQAAERLKKENDKADEQQRALIDLLAKEREDHERAIKDKDKSLAASTNRFAGVRHALETDLSAARGSGEACTARIAGISEALGGVFDSVGEVASFAKDLGRENGQLKADNRSLSEKLAGWQKWNAERTQHVTVIGQKNN